jgi:hypothetical protein
MSPSTDRNNAKDVGVKYFIFYNLTLMTSKNNSVLCRWLFSGMLRHIV